MNRRSWKYFLISGIVVLALAATAPQADAGWWGSGGCGCGWSSCGGCYSSCCSPCCYSSCCSPCYSCCGDAPVTAAPVTTAPAAAAPTPAKKPVKPTMPSEPAAPAASAMPAPTTPAAPATPAPATPATSLPSKPAAPAAPAVPDPFTPTAPATPAPATPAPSLPGLLPPDPKTSSTIDDSGVLTVWVPADANVTVNGRETPGTGGWRQFISYGLKAGFSYKYVVRAEVVRNGQPQTDTREVTLTAGERTTVAFGFNATSSQQVAAR